MLDVISSQLVGLPSNIVSSVAAVSYPGSGYIGQTTNNATPGVETQLKNTSFVPKNGIWVRSLSTNTGIIYIGATGVSSTTGYGLLPGESHCFTSFSNLNAVYMVSSVASEKVCYEAS